MLLKHVVGSAKPIRNELASLPRRELSSSPGDSQERVNDSD